MFITSLQITDFRNLRSALLCPASAGCNVIYGDNGSGKTSLLEAVYYISLGRSFRGSTPSQLIHHEANHFTVFSQLLNETERQLAVGIERDRKGGSRWRLDNQEINTSIDIVSLLPVLLINAHSHHLLELGPNCRRKFLDWGLFYQFDQFLDCYKKFCKAIRQRNALLRAGGRNTEELNSWTAALVRQALIIDALRKQYVSELSPLLTAAAQALLNISDLKIHYHPGWDDEMDYPAALKKYLRDDQESGYTQYGPHRADFRLTINGRSAKHCLSRGQQKLLISAMMVAQGQLLAHQCNKNVLYLIDDLPSELDRESRQKMMAALTRQQAQVFVTAIEKDTICECVPTSAAPAKMFHVERGVVMETD